MAASKHVTPQSMNQYLLYFENIHGNIFIWMLFQLQRELWMQFNCTLPSCILFVIEHVNRLLYKTLPYRSEKKFFGLLRDCEITMIYVEKMYFKGR